MLPPEGASGYTDRQFYECGSLGGGLGYSVGRLRALWNGAPFSVRVLRQMNKASKPDAAFGEDFLWALLAAKDQAGHPAPREGAPPPAPDTTRR